MLSLNASIESARAGELGKGFSVVAKEMRKLSDNSKQTIIRISELTSNIQGSVTKTMDTSNYTFAATENQSSTIEEINASVQEVISMTEQMNNLAGNDKAES